MTTMELNLRKQNFTEFILSMDEEEFTELEKYAVKMGAHRKRTNHRNIPLL